LDNAAALAFLLLPGPLGFIRRRLPWLFPGHFGLELLSLFLAMTSNEGCFGFALTQAEEGQNEHDHHN
jgi:hypothetical protein